MYEILHKILQVKTYKYYICFESKEIYQRNKYIIFHYKRHLIYCSLMTYNILYFIFSVTIKHYRLGIHIRISINFWRRFSGHTKMISITIYFLLPDVWLFSFYLNRPFKHHIYHTRILYTWSIEYRTFLTKQTLIRFVFSVRIHNKTFDRLIQFIFCFFWKGCFFATYRYAQFVFNKINRIAII